ncbi:hypothetical protein AeNC1_002748 [Aphanomyces euteiches]|nr:hypothetical protein AeNC1_002748 [Aphanomyces euteiches]
MAWRCAYCVYQIAGKEREGSAQDLKNKGWSWESTVHFTVGLLAAMLYQSPVYMQKNQVDVYYAICSAHFLREAPLSTPDSEFENIRISLSGLEISDMKEEATPVKRQRLEEPKKDESTAPATPPVPEESKKAVRWVEKGPLLVLGEDGLTVSGTKGYCMARTNASVKNGMYYYEIKLLPSIEPYHVRFGWGMKKADINAPVGFDEYSYAYRDIGGVTVHRSKRSEDYGESFGVGDVVGAMICVNWEENASKPTPEATPQTLPGRFFPPSLVKQTSDNAPTPLRIDKASYIRFFVNGKDQGVAFEAMPFGEYYPMVSIYGGGSITANFGPTFAYPPPSDAKPVPPDVN